MMGYGGPCGKKWLQKFPIEGSTFQPRDSTRGELQHRKLVLIHLGGGCCQFAPIEYAKALTTPIQTLVNTQWLTNHQLAQRFTLPAEAALPWTSSNPFAARQ